MSRLENVVEYKTVDPVAEEDAKYEIVEWISRGAVFPKLKRLIVGRDMAAGSWMPSGEGARGDGQCAAGAATEYGDTGTFELWTESAETHSKYYRRPDTMCLLAADIDATNLHFPATPDVASHLMRYRTRVREPHIVRLLMRGCSLYVGRHVPRERDVYHASSPPASPDPSPLRCSRFRCFCSVPVSSQPLSRSIQ